MTPPQTAAVAAGAALAAFAAYLASQRGPEPAEAITPAQSGPCGFCTCGSGIVGCATGSVPAGQGCTVCVDTTDGALVPCLQPLPMAG